MSEAVEGQGAQAKVEQPQVTPEMFQELQDQMNRVMSTNERLLTESKEWKSKAQIKSEELELIEKQKLQDSGKLEELLELERNKAHEATQKAKSLERETLKKSLHLEVAAIAKDAHDVRDILGSINPEVVTYDEVNGGFKGLDDAVAELRANKPYMFNSNKIPATPDGRPTAQVPVSKTLEERITENPNDVLAEALGQFLR